jgi:hypothetical protein
MSEENVEIIRQAFVQLGERPTTEALEEFAGAGLIALDAELDFSAMYPDGPILRGIEAWVDYLGALPCGRSVRPEPERFFDVDAERVLVFVYVTAVGETSGVPVGLRNAYEFTMRDRVLVRWKIYADRNQALEAAGLQE